MSLVITLTDNAVTRFTFTKSETRLKLSKDHSNPVNNDLIKFAEMVEKFLISHDTQVTLRGFIVQQDTLYKIELSDSNHTKHLYYTITGDQYKLHIL